MRPARVRCTNPACGRTQVLLPAWCVPGRADDADTIGSALLAAAAGQGHRPIAERLGVPADTVRGWLAPVDRLLSPPRVPAVADGAGGAGAVCRGRAGLLRRNVRIVARFCA